MTAPSPPDVVLTPAPRRAWLAWLPVCLILLAFVCATAPRLGYPARPVFDELYTATAAQEYVEGQPVHEQTHPPLTKLFMAAGYQAWLGGRFEPATPTWSPIAFAIRTPSIVAGVACLALTYAIARAMFASQGLALVAMGLLALDGMFLVLSRTAMTNIYGMAFTLLGTLGTWLAIRDDRPRWLLLAGLGFGLGMACRWTAVVGAGVNVLCLLAFLAATRAGRDRAAWRAWAGAFALGAVALPIFLYCLSYLPHLAAVSRQDGVPLFSWAMVQYGVALQRDMIAIHTVPMASHPAESPWWSWPLVLKPTWFYMRIGTDPREIGEAIYPIGNVFLWWAFLPMLAYAAYQGVAKRDRRHAMLGALAAALWLVWAVGGSSRTWIHYMFECLPFDAILVATVVWGQVERARRGAPHAALRLALVGGYGLGAVAWTVWFYPLYTARPITVASYQQHMLLGKRWDALAMCEAWALEVGGGDPRKVKAYFDENFLNPERFGRYLDDHKTRPVLPPGQAPAPDDDWAKGISPASPSAR